MNPLLSQFVTEGRDLLEQIGQRLLALEQAPNDATQIGELFGLLHTLKGNSGLFEFPSLTRVAHAAEDVLDRVRHGELAIGTELIDDLLSVADFVLRVLDQIEASEQLPARFGDEAAQLVTRLKGSADDQPGTTLSALATPGDWSWLSRVDEAGRTAAFAAAQPNAELIAVRYLPEPECFFNGEDPLLTLRNLPERLAFSIQPLAAWPPLAEFDVFRCNLLIDAISCADHERVTEHFRAIPEQVAIYRLPAYALALPEGERSAGSSMHADFVAEARRHLAAENRAELRVAVDALLERLDPALFLSSALRWCQRLLDRDAPLRALAVLVDAIASDSPPNWHGLIGPDAVSRSLGGVDQTANPPLEDADEAMWRQILATQRRLLDLPTPPAQWAGRLAALHNTLASLFYLKADTSSLSKLAGAIDSAQQTRSLTPLAAMLDGTAFAPPPLAAEPDRAPSLPAPEPPASAEDPNFGRRAEDAVAGKAARILKVPQEKIDRLMDLIGEMVVAKNALPYLATRAEEVYGSRELNREIRVQYAVINRIAEEMQDGIMQVRMLPVGAVFQRFSRLVRDVTKQLGKKVRLTVEGEDIEADKNVVEALGEPLIHILRNSLDHGFELPEVRVAAGKPEEGRLTVRASYEGDRVLIEVTDDGKGIDPAEVKRIAFEKGVLDEERLDTISDHEAVQLVFAAGFSTVKVVSDLSGRGVGMDVVRSSLEKLGGQVTLTSEKGVGTRIVLTLPLSMAVSNVMMVHIGGQSFGVPTELVIETVRIPERDTHTLKDRRTAVLRGQIVPLFGADELLKLATPPQPNSDGELAVLVTQVAGEPVGLVVDGFAQAMDVFLKPLEGPLAGLAGFAGTALLGDGSVLLVLDLKELF